MTTTLSVARRGGDALTRHVEQVTSIRGYCQPPEEWTALVGRLCDFRAPTTSSPLRDKLIDAIIGGGADETRLAELRALAEAEATPINATLMQIVQGAVQAELYAIFDPVALDAYRCVATVFDKAAARFAACVSKCDVEADSEEVVGLPAGARSAWIDAVGIAGQLDAHLEALVAAAELAGHDIDRDELLIPLIVRNLDSLHRRRLWEAFLSANPVAPQKQWVSKREIANQWTPPRCGRWSALAGLGAELGAADLTDGLAPYGRPGPLDRRQRRIKGSVSDAVTIFDPCDPDYAAQLEAAGFPVVEDARYAGAH